MNPIPVFIVGLALLMAITVSWYVTMPVVAAVINSVASAVASNQGASGALNIGSYVAVLWGPICDVAVIIWMALSMQARDIESEVYYY